MMTKKSNVQTQPALGTSKEGEKHLRILYSIFQNIQNFKAVIVGKFKMLKDFLILISCLSIDLILSGSWG